MILLRALLSGQLIQLNDHCRCKNEANPLQSLQDARTRLSLGSFTHLTFTTFIIIDQFYGLLRNTSRRKLTQTDICGEKLFPQFCIFSLILLMTKESINIQHYLVATVAIQQQLVEWIICLKYNKTVRFVVPPQHLQA